MKNMTIFGAQWGDEGKGKIVDLLGSEVDYIVRYQGGNNAGHTVIVDGKKYVLHIIPSGILHEGKMCVIGNGVVLDLQVFLNELDALSAKGIDISPERLLISPRAHIIMPYHCLLDSYREGVRSEEVRIGTTGRGIGPCYEDKVARRGIRVADLAEPAQLRAKVEDALVEKNILFQSLYNEKALSVDEVYQTLMELAPRILPYMQDTTSALLNAFEGGKVALFEGAQGLMLDIDHGTYPFVTSSNTVSSNAAVGAGVPMSAITRQIAIVKAYTTRVGAGPFPTELFCETGKYLQEKGGEFGATTGRTRRCGWFDAAVLRETCRLCAPTSFALTKLDVLGGLDEIKICVAYEHKGDRILYPPQTVNGLADVTPIYESLAGWKEDISTCTTWESLPENARKYVEKLEELIGAKAEFVSVGPDRNQTIRR